jgi:hypothetical protein
MQAIAREDVPVVIEDNGVEVRLCDEAGISEYVDFSPTDKFQPVIDHITSGAAASA